MRKKAEEEYFRKVVKIPLKAKETLMIEAIKNNVSFVKYISELIENDYNRLNDSNPFTTKKRNR